MAGGWAEWFCLSSCFMCGIWQQLPEEVGNIGKLLIMEFSDNESVAFADIMNMLQKYPDFRKYTLKDGVILSLPGM